MPRPSERLPHVPSRLAAALLAAALLAGVGAGVCAAAAAATPASEPLAPFVARYCVDCHGAAVRKGQLDLEALDPARLAADAATWEKVLRKLDHRQMPPHGEERPDAATYTLVVAHLTSALDQAAAAQPDPGRPDSLRRLTRTEYQNAIRDLLHLEIDATALLPHDEPSLGFDNVTVGHLSPTLLDRYVSAAQKIARLALGAPRKSPGGDTYRIPPDVTQEDHVAGLPPGTRGGLRLRHVFPQDGEYEIQLRLARDRNEQVEGLRRPHEVEVLLDRASVARFTVKPPGSDKNAELVDAHLKFRLDVSAGPHDLGVTFLKDPSALIETERQPFLARFNMHRHPRTAPALYQVSITGPYRATGPGDTSSRRRILGAALAAAPATPAAQEERARHILAPLLRRAYRRPVTDEDLRRPLEFFRQGRDEDGFEAGLEHALGAILVSPSFLLRVESDPPGLAPGAVYRLGDFELASRLAFFLWSSLPDDPLLEAAERGDLRDPARLEAQVLRMLADERARNLVTNFAAQWLHLRGLEGVTPDLRLFPDFDDNLRQAFRQETELFVESIFREDRPVTALLHADYTFLNERLARHYGIPHIHGSRFRRVELGGDATRQRGGLLRHGSILTVTSYATRTSPVIRGHWILANLVGSPPPPPPPDVPALESAKVAAGLPIRERLAAHRANPACASCHTVMDPVGFALENFDAVGRWRAAEEGRPIDAAGGLPDGTAAAGVAALERGLLARPELLAGTLAEKLLVFALGRAVHPHDAPALRQIVRRAHADQFRFSSLVLGLVQSTPFQYRKAP